MIPGCCLQGVQALFSTILCCSDTSFNSICGPLHFIEICLKKKKEKKRKEGKEGKNPEIVNYNYFQSKILHFYCVMDSFDLKILSFHWQRLQSIAPSLQFLNTFRDMEKNLLGFNLQYPSIVTFVLSKYSSFI